MITAGTGEEALKKLDADLDVVLVDVRMPGMDGLSFIRKARRLKPKLQFVAMTGCGTVDTAASVPRIVTWTTGLRAARRLAYSAWSLAT